MPSECLIAQTNAQKSAFEGSLAELQQFVKDDPSCLRPTEPTHYSPLMAACVGKKGDLHKRNELVLWLMKQPYANLAMCTRSATLKPVDAAALNGYTEIVLLLLHRGDEPLDVLNVVAGASFATYFGKISKEMRILLLKDVLWRRKLHLWRPVHNPRFPFNIRRELRTLLILGKARVTTDKLSKRQIDFESQMARWPQSCLCLLPEEIRQYLFTFVAAFGWES
jgi:hypothetical protein